MFVSHQRLAAAVAGGQPLPHLPPFLAPDQHDRLSLYLLKRPVFAAAPPPAVVVPFRHNRLPAAAIDRQTTSLSCCRRPRPPTTPSPGLQRSPTRQPPPSLPPQPSVNTTLEVA